MNTFYSDVKDKRILITGASGGIGSAMTSLFTDLGSIVGIHYHQDKSAAEKLKARVIEGGGRAGVFQADLLEEQSREDLIERFISKFEIIDVLINNAGGIVGNKHYLEVDADSWRSTFALNVEAPFFLSQNVFPLMSKEGGGRIINISSVAAKYGGSDTSVHYGAAKAALENMTISLAKKGAPDKILVNTIRAGVIDTDFHKKSPKKNFKDRVEMIPLGRLGSPEDVAELALFLSSDTSRYITGQTLGVTGGE